MRKKKRRRLHLDRLLSIGAVEAGDNPESDIVLWKSAPESGARSRTGSPAPVAERVAGFGSPSTLTVAEYVAKRLDRGKEALNAIADSCRQMSDEIGDMRMPRTAKPPEPGTVRAEVDALAAEMVKKGEAPNITQARPMIWKGRPDLVAASRKAQESERGGRPAVGESGKTISDRVREIVNEATRRASWQPLLQGWGDGMTRDQIIAKVRVEVWRSPDGQELRDLDRAFGSRTYTPAASSEIRKSRGGDRYARALNLLDSGIWEQ